MDQQKIIFEKTNPGRWEAQAPNGDIMAVYRLPSYYAHKWGLVFTNRDRYASIYEDTREACVYQASIKCAFDFNRVVFRK